MEKNFDVLVLGGGTAGVIAAIAAARQGARTLIIEKNGHLGGTAVTGLPFLGMFDGRNNRVNAGIAQELVERMKAEQGSLDGCFGATWMNNSYQFSITPYEQETYKYVAQEMVLDAGAQILFHTFLAGAKVEDGRIQAVEVVNKSGTSRYTAKVYIDTTGDADVARHCGVPMLEKSVRQNASMLFRVGGVNMHEFLDALKNGQGVAGWGKWHTRVILGPRLDTHEIGPIHLAGHFIGDNGQEITFTAISLISTEVYLNATRTVNVDGASAEDLSRAEIAERRNVHKIMKILREHIPGFENSHLIFTAPVGIRESRNIQGEYILEKEDVLSGRQFDDSVARGSYPIDIHDPQGGRTQFSFIQDCGSYSIPYRCLLPKGIANLLVAGRCLSATHEAMGSARIMGAVMGQGQAAGTAAAMAALSGKDPGAVSIRDLQAALVEKGAIL